MKETMKAFGGWLINRLSENSTYRGLILLATAIGIKLDPEQMTAITATGLALVGLINVFRKAPGAADGASPSVPTVGLNLAKNMLLTFMTVFIFAGCMSLNKAVLVTSKVADKAMFEWAVMSEKGKTSAEFDANVEKAYAFYQKACRSARIAYETAPEAPATKDIVYTVQVSLLQLIDMIAQVLPPDKASALKIQARKAEVKL
jgi:hypothetical protein